MNRVLVLALSIASVQAQFVTPSPASMPAWIVPYPGATAQRRQVGNSAESTYMVAAPAREVLAHFRSLFASAGQPFQPSSMGYGFFILAAVPECDLSVSIERLEQDARIPNTKVKITCSPRFSGTQRILDQQDQARVRMAQNDGMKKFDQPVYPEPKPPAPPLAWPAWLVRVDGAKLDVQRLAGQLRSSFLSAPSREAIQAFYAQLLGSHGYRVTQSQAAVPQQFGSWVMGTDGQNSRIRVNVKPVGQNYSVELSVQ